LLLKSGDGPVCGARAQQFLMAGAGAIAKIFQMVEAEPEIWVPLAQG